MTKKAKDMPQTKRVGLTEKALYLRRKKNQKSERELILNEMQWVMKKAVMEAKRIVLVERGDWSS